VSGPIRLSEADVVRTPATSPPWFLILPPAFRVCSRVLVRVPAAISGERDGEYA
jgi:hypothetical protein